MDQISCILVTLKWVIYKSEKDSINISGASVWTPKINVGQVINHTQK